MTNLDDSCTITQHGHVGDMSCVGMKADLATIEQFLDQLTLYIMHDYMLLCSCRPGVRGAPSFLILCRLHRRQALCVCVCVCACVCVCVCVQMVVLAMPVLSHTYIGVLLSRVRSVSALTWSSGVADADHAGHSRRLDCFALCLP